MAPMHNPEQGIQEAKPPQPPAGAITTAPATSAPVKPKIDRAAAFTRRLTRIDGFLALLLLVLTFFVASFAVQNSDFWLHLATGRLIAEGEYQFGQDPFSYASEGPWINHAWLYDWAVYNLYQLFGGTVLVVLKGLAVVGLVLILLQIRRPGMRWLIPVLILALAVLTLNPRLLFQPTILSYLFLGITMWVLLREPRADGSTGRLWWLPALFVLWVNVDSWFVLGPLALAFFLLGSWIGTRRGQPAPYPLRTVAAVLGVGVVACLINPHHVQAFQLPPYLAYPLVELADLFHIPLPELLVAGGRTLQNVHFIDPQTSPAFSPFWMDHFRRVWSPLLISYVAYYVLLALGLVSFALQTPLVRSPAPFPWTRVLLWGFFALLGALQIQMVPFFAIISAPIVVLNFQDFLRRELAPDVALPGAAQSEAALPGAAVPRAVVPRVAPGWLLLGRLGAVAAMLAVVALAWPGWLGGTLGQEMPWGTPRSARRVAWQIEPDPSLKQSSLALRDLHAAGKIRNGFNDSHEQAHYWAWFCPEVKNAFDARWPLFTRSLADYGKLRRTLQQEALGFLRRERGREATLQEWSRLARDRDVDFFAFSPRNVYLLARRWLDERHWPALYQDGRTVVFGWNPDKRKDTFAGLTVDFHRQAFGAVADSDKPPAVGPEPPTKPRGFLHDYAFGLPPTPLALAEIDVLQRYYQVFSDSWVDAYLAAWQWAGYHGPAVTTVVAPGNVLHPWAVLMHLFPPAMRQRNPNTGWPNLKATNLGPPAVPLLMVRRARSGVAQSPLDARSYIDLHEALAILFEQETFWSLRPADPITVWSPGSSWDPGAVRATLRSVQQINALKNALVLEPANPPLQQNVGNIYLRMNFLDIVPEHWRAALRQYDRLRPPAGAQKEAHEDFQKRKQFLDRSLSELETHLKQRREDFRLHHGGQKTGEQVVAALFADYKIVDKKTGQPHSSKGMGLPGLALSILEKIPAEQLQKDDPRFVAFVSHTQMSLWLMLGRAKEVRDVLPGQRRWLESKENELAPQHFFKLRESLALIHLWAAGAVGDYPAMDSALAELEKSHDSADVKSAFSALTRRLLLVPPINPDAQVNALIAWSLFEGHYRQLLVFSQASAEFRILRGIIALERGDTAAATDHFQRLFTDLGAWVPHPDRSIAQRYLELLRKK